MIINTGQRTDIPAFYSEWFFNRIKDGFVMVRNPYYPEQVTRYELKPEVVDVLSFCTKNPAPMLDKLDLIKNYRQYWFVTITPYGKEIEPNVPDKAEIIKSVKKLSEKVGKSCVGWRYDPIFITDKYSLDFHINAFEEMAKELKGYVHQAVISFIDLYEKTKRNFPEAREVLPDERGKIGESFAAIGKKYGIKIRTCFEGTDLAKFGIDCSGCITQRLLESSIGEKLNAPKRKGPRSGCNCLLGNDIGAYNTCLHFCRYCYANYDKMTVIDNSKNHDPASPLLIGILKPTDNIKYANQKSYIDNQLSLI